MTITPEQAKTLNCNDYPRPWEIGQVPVFDAWDDYEEAWYAGPAIVYDEDIAPLVAATPVMAAQIAEMRWEYAPQVHIDGNWKYYTGWGNRKLPEPPFNTPAHTFEVGWFNSEEEARRIAPPPDWAEYRIVRRLVSPTEETK